MQSMNRNNTIFPDGYVHFETEGSKGNDLLHRNWNREKATHAIRFNSCQ